MDFLSYRGLPMRILQSTVHERAPQHDKSNSTYECTRWLVSFLVTYNPEAISYHGLGGNIIPQPLSGRMPVLTDTAIRKFLEQPRGQLIVRSATTPNMPYVGLVNPNTDPGSIVICSPTGAGAAMRPCDARNGPFCKVNSIQEVPGERLWKIHLTFETYVNENTGYPFILNNRWSVHQDINWQHMSTRVYQGICTVNAALLNDPNFTAAQTNALGLPGYIPNSLDSIRQSFAGFSVPVGFQRTFVKVEMTPDRNSAVYVVRDEQRHYNQPNALNVPKIDVQDANYVQHGSWGRAVAQNMGQPPIGLNFTPFFGPILMGEEALRRAAGAIAANLPRFNRNVIVRVWGNPKIQRPDLVSIGLAVASNRMGGAPILDTTTSELVVTGDSNRLITVNWSCQWGRDNAFASFTNAIAAITAFFLPGLTGAPGGTSFASSTGTDLNVTAAVPAVGSFQLTPNIVANPPMGGRQAGQGNTRSVLGSDTGNIAPLITQVLEGFNIAPGTGDSLP